MPSQTELRKTITVKVVQALKDGKTLPWRCPWVGHRNSGLPTNIVSNKRYRGINVLLLHLHQLRFGLKSKFFGTFNQWKNIAAHVRPRPADVPPGKWGCQVIFFKPITKVEEDDNGEEREVAIPVLRSYTVFGIDQVEGAHLDRFRVGEISVNSGFIDYEPAERAVAAIGADIRFGGEQAFYRRATPNGDGDYICCPHKHRFPKEKEFYAVLAHELAHWSESRLEWKGNYAEGELRAEMAAAFALAELGVPQSDDLSNVASYLQNWLSALSNDPKLLFRISSDASKAVDYLLSFSRSEVQEPEEVLAE
jgi:antirestriction protein ArdC